MLSRAHRLSDRRDVNRVFRMGRRVNGNLFSFLFLPNSSGESRFTVVVGKKFFPRAIDRTHLKRLTRESIRPLIPRIVPGYDGAFLLARKPTETPSLPLISTDIETLLQKSRLLT